MKRRTLIVFAKSRSWYAPIISAITGTWFNHVFMVYEDEDFDSWMVLDILTDGPVVLPVKRAMKRYKRIECWEYEGNLWNGVVKSKDDIGSGYDWLGLFAALFKLIIFKLFRIRRMNPIQWASKYMCFEWIMTVIKRSNVVGWESLNPAVVPPSQLYTLLENREDFLQVMPPMEIWNK